VKNERFSESEVEVDEEELAAKLYEAIEELVGDETVRDISAKTGLSNGVVTRLVKPHLRTRWPSIFVLERLGLAYGRPLILGFE
tara:strand:+ start:379 stop:630 length:252 start_codon:yes stop_codon:yes gene_type:complete